MRIISGIAKGRRLKVPKEDVRPSTDRLREALFSILGPLVDGARVCDLFAGSGSLGLEALSRGAASATAVESGRLVLKALRDNARSTGLPLSIVSSDVFAFLGRGGGPFDLIFADPPYEHRRGDREFAAELLEDAALKAMLADDGLLVLEVHKDAPLPAAAGWRVVDDRSYGVCRILFYRKGEA